MKKFVGFVMIICMVMVITMPVMASNNVLTETETETLENEEKGCFEAMGKKIDDTVATAGKEITNGASYVGKKIKLGTGYALTGIGSGLEWLHTNVEQPVTSWFINIGNELKG